MVEGDIFKKILSEEDKINRALTKIFNLMDANGRRPAAYYDLRCSGSSLGILYGLPKIHKRGAPSAPFYLPVIPLVMVLPNILSLFCPISPPTNTPSKILFLLQKS